MISIAMTTYNGTEYVCKQVESIINQTYEDFELIIVDDNSTDGTYEKLKYFESKDKRLRVYKNEINIGVVKNFEKAISLCTGEYIALCDQDDIWNCNHIKQLISQISLQSAAVANANIIDETDQFTGESLSMRDRYFVDGDNEAKLMRILFYGNPFQGTSSMYSRELIEKALPIPEGIEYHDAWLSACACCDRGLNYSSTLITNYRIHSANVSGNHQISFLKQVKTTLKRKGYKTDRLIFCQMLLDRFPNMDSSLERVVMLAYDFYTCRRKGQRLKVLGYLIRYYKTIYATNNYKLLIPRILGVLLKG